MFFGVTSIHSSSCIYSIHSSSVIKVLGAIREASSLPLALWLVELGLADVATVDAVMEASGFKMGPFKLMDLIGMDINYGVSNIVWEALGKPERLTPSALQKAKVDAGELGRKTGKGFYQY